MPVALVVTVSPRLPGLLGPAGWRAVAGGRPLVALPGAAATADALRADGVGGRPTCPTPPPRPRCPATSSCLAAPGEAAVPGGRGGRRPGAGRRPAARRRRGDGPAALARAAARGTPSRRTPRCAATCSRRRTRPTTRSSTTTRWRCARSSATSCCRWSSTPGWPPRRPPDRRFDIDDVAGDLVDKLVRRHPHVFGDAGPRDVAAGRGGLGGDQAGREAAPLADRGRLPVAAGGRLGGRARPAGRAGPGCRRPAPAELTVDQPRGAGGAAARRRRRGRAARLGRRGRPARGGPPLRRGARRRGRRPRPAGLSRCRGEAGDGRPAGWLGCPRGQHRRRRRAGDPRLARKPHRGGRGRPRRRDDRPGRRAQRRLHRRLRGGGAARRRRALRRQGRDQGRRRRPRRHRPRAGRLRGQRAAADRPAADRPRRHAGQVAPRRQRHPRRQPRGRPGGRRLGRPAAVPLRRRPLGAPAAGADDEHPQRRRPRRQQRRRPGVHDRADRRRPPSPRRWPWAPRPTTRSRPC